MADSRGNSELRTQNSVLFILLRMISIVVEGVYCIICVYYEFKQITWIGNIIFIYY